MWHIVYSSTKIPVQDREQSEKASAYGCDAAACRHALTRRTFQTRSPARCARRSSAAREEGIVVPGFGGGGRRDNAAQLVRGDGEHADGAGWVLRSVLRAPRS